MPVYIGDAFSPLRKPAEVNLFFKESMRNVNCEAKFCDSVTMIVSLIFTLWFLHKHSLYRQDEFGIL